jgi:hypothetical protein
MDKVLLVLIVLFWNSCKKEKAPVPAPVPVSCNLPEQVSYANNIQPVFNAHCIDAGCHSGANPGGHLNLETSVSYTQLMKSGSGYIDTLKPEFSVLYSQMNSASNPMPKTGKLDDCTIGLVLKWIQQKAKNN